MGTNNLIGHRWQQGKITCAYCGKPIGASVIHQHAAKCWQNPDYIEMLQATITPDMRAADYDKISASLGLPNYSRIRRDFSSWDNFIKWLFGIKNDDVAELIQAELAANIAAVRKPWDGLPVFDSPRREWDANGMKFVSWGVK